MPMDFPDMKSLEFAAECHKFRKPNEGETEADYRAALASHVEPIDLVESMEIRSKHGWDKFDESENMQMLMRSAMRNRR